MRLCNGHDRTSSIPDSDSLIIIKYNVTGIVLLRTGVVAAATLGAATRDLASSAVARLGTSIALISNIHDHLSTRIVLTWFCIRLVNVRTLVDCSCQCRAFDMLFICVLRGR